MSDFIRLNVLAPDLVELSYSISPNQRFNIAVQVAKLACQKTEALRSIDDMVSDILSGKTHLSRNDVRSYLAKKLDFFDEKYFNLTEKNDGFVPFGEAQIWFSKARAIASLLYSIDGMYIQSFCNALYESITSTNELNEIRRLCYEHYGNTSDSAP